MSAGTGVMHSEFNHSRTDPVHFLQIWIVPKFTGVKPSYQERFFAPAEKRGKLQLIASQDARDGSLKLWQDASVYAGLIDGGERVEYHVVPEHRVYVHVARGEVSLCGQVLSAGDGVKLCGKPMVTLTDGKDAEVLLFDLA
jgi:redox-sensitive bicupin YhaK (pirin superfamily)